MLRQLLSDSLSWIPNAAPPSMFGAPLSCLEPSISETLVSMSAYIPSISSLSPIVLCFLYSASSTHFFLPFASPYLAGRQTKHWKLRHEASKLQLMLGLKMSLQLYLIFLAASTFYGDFALATDPSVPNNVEIKAIDSNTVLMSRRVSVTLPLLQEGPLPLPPAEKPIMGSAAGAPSRAIQTKEDKVSVTTGKSTPRTKIPLSALSNESATFTPNDESTMTTKSVSSNSISIFTTNAISRSALTVLATAILLLLRSYGQLLN
ncbi:hypothetical protein TcWFU_003187 [Taenia crassiceps]